MNSKTLATTAAIAAMALGIFLALSVIQAPGGKQLIGGVLLNAPREIRDFELVDANGEAFTHDNLKGQWTAIFPGFTHCPDICPQTLGLLQNAMAGMEADAKARWQIVFLSVDPERDTPEALRQYVGYFSEEFVGATGSADAIARLARDLAVAYHYTPTGDDSYTVDHTAAIVLINPAGQVAGYLQPPFKPHELSADLRTASLGS